MSLPPAMWCECFPSFVPARLLLFLAITVASVVRNSGRPIAEVCRDLGIGESTVYQLVRRLSETSLERNRARVNKS